MASISPWAFGVYLPCSGTEQVEGQNNLVYSLAFVATSGRCIQPMATNNAR